MSARHNMGMALDRRAWLRLHGCAERFCRYDDYNWDWSLLAVAQTCLKPPNLRVLMARGPRQLSSTCGSFSSGQALQSITHEF